MNAMASWLFTQPFVRAQIKEEIKAPLCEGNRLGDREVSDAVSDSK